MSELREFTPADFQNEWPERVFGSETEYTTDVLSYRGQVISRTFSKDYSTVNRLIDFVNPEHVASIGRDTYKSAVTTYGGELYIDMGMLEYATAEVQTPEEVVQQERKGGQVSEQTAANIASSHPEMEEDAPPQVIYKRSGYANVYGAENLLLLQEMSVGNHENYYSISDLTQLNWDSVMEDGLAPNQNIAEHPGVRLMTSYLVLRKLFDGVGMIGEEGFSLSQKPYSFDFSSFDLVQNHGDKPAFWVHDDRFEVRTGEGNKSDWVIKEKFGLTSLMLRLVEHEQVPAHLLLKDPNSALESITYDPFAAVILENGDERRGIDTLRDMVHEAAEFAYANSGILPYEEKAIYEFDKFYRDLHTVDLHENTIGSLGYLDWSARFQYFVDLGGSFRYMNTTDLSLIRHDLLWDQVRPNDVARKYLVRLGGTALTIPEPIPKGRARERVELARDLYAAGNLSKVYWDYVVPISGSSSYHLPNPFGGNLKHKK